MLEKRPEDTGLQPQRTVLSWFRTVAVIFLNALLLMKVGLCSENTLFIVLGGTILLLATLMYSYSVQRNLIIDYNIELVDNKTVNMHRTISILLSIIAFLLFFYFAHNLFYDFSRL
ncbi:DUF202 domain-containing protein [Aliivibrio fischeri]|uniref:DUF202 domain-containing protein n=1 Tax=Aliivibrio fischeri SR5 TaxID=1088719 RepID=A0AAV3EPU6_ALIFS|nr:DUF202 domain-containing protein [Aliivibrio fischeri]EHN68753.1 hypothetical protein VFSR5_A0050 [Aliivibrio fischeri SR5]